MNEQQQMSIVSQAYWAQKLYNEATRELLLFQRQPYIYRKTTRWQRFKWRMLAYRERVHGAWLVLVGKAEIYDGQDD